ncbi:glycosyltransferase family 4 protein [Planococcus salinus]|uniref:Glycosyltransferase n=1 Tax=Planococcus salinus TaxID=1848460 RepID=A0A3M8P868_9BACL|nr:glycosyltransferase [Planococcus salinus]RNF39621.1 glycosyltransferase [Planococcus salinus]
MKVTFFSNFLNHHQLSFCLEMYKLLGEDFKFVATEPIPAERINLGYSDMSNLYPFSLNTYTDNENKEEAVRLGNNSDVVIIGSAPTCFIKDRNKKNKLTFYYMERIFKKGKYRILNPKVFISLLKNHTLNTNKNLYMLCASAYTAADFNMVGAYKNKTFKWGYFPEVKEHFINELIYEKNKNEKMKLLWVGRFIKWKHPEQAIEIARMLKTAGYNFTLQLIGNGEMKISLNKLITQYGLSDYVEILGSMDPKRVREYMESSNIYLFTSDFNEGWGAVLNEAMNSGCAVVASHAIGSVPFMLENNKNGLIYKNGDLKHFYQCVTKLMDDPKLREVISVEAYKTVENSWNSKEAAKRILNLSQSIMQGKNTIFVEGPCSRALIQPNRYVSYKNEISNK